MPELLPPDHAQRARVTTALDATLFVEAGAGSGKTRSLVERIVALVTVAGVPMGEIAAITFTDKAAAELRDRVRRTLEGVAQQESGLVADRAHAALGELDGAAVSTLHAFAQRLLTEHPLAAGLPPRVEVADELTSQLAFEERWATYLDELLDPARLASQPDDELALVLLLDARRPIEALRDIALEFERNWDLVAEHVHGRARPPLAPLDVGPLVGPLLAVAAERVHGDDGDKLVADLATIESLAQQLAGTTELRDQHRVLGRLGGLKPAKGNKQKWKGGPYRNDLDPLRRQVDDELAACRAAAREVSEAALRRLAAHLAEFTLAAAQERRREGRLAFHDLLVLARGLLRDPVHGQATRAILHQRYTRLLLDEFQDTDPIQLEIAVLLGVDPAVGAAEAAAGGAGAWPVPGRLFFVGDPKQSIYRFRRADIATFLATPGRLAAEPVTLSANFRTTGAVVAWVNGTFARLITEEPGAQPAYQPLTAVRETDLAGPAVLTFGGVHHDKPPAPAMRAREVADVAEVVRRAVGSWEVVCADGERRPARYGDVAILIPTRTILDPLEDALDESSIPFRTESSSLAYASREVRALLLALRAIDDPSDDLALVSTLRSPLFGCSDADLLRWRAERGARWSTVTGELPARLDGDDPVHDAMVVLRALAAERYWHAPAELLDRLVRDRRVLEVAAGQRRARDVWRRVRYLIDQARAWREAGGRGLRDYLAWAYRQASDSIRVTEAVLPETDHDAVRIMTIHAAKGLEFPIVVLAGLTTQPRSSRAGVDVIWTPAGPQLRLDDTFVTRDYEVTRQLDEQLDEHERRRLLYVGCTRARDHLAVSVHCRAAGSPSRRSTLAELVAEHCAGLDRAHLDELRELEPAGPAGPVASVAPAAGTPPAAFDLAAWEAEQAALVATAGRPHTVAATTLAGHVGPEPHHGDDPGLAKGGVDLDLPPWRKGRYGTAIGRAVHAVLQTIDLATGEGLEEAAAAQAAAEGVIGREGTIVALARSALRAPVVHDAVTAPSRWREVLVAAPIGERLLEGYIDLLFRTDDGLVVVDYKTDQPRDEADMDARVARYRRQLAAYALAIGHVTGEEVLRAVLVFCATRGPAREREVPDLGAAMEEVAAELAAATSGTLPAPLV
jgi:ATP-dependent exoDNAse (exonuclease V) beta subunit